MLKQISFLFALIITPLLSYSQENFSPTETRISIEPLTHLQHKKISSIDIRDGYAISSPGTYSINSSHVKIESGDSPTNSHNVGGSSETRSIIAITSSNVILDLGGTVINTDKSSHVAITVEDSLHDVIIRNGIISSGSANFDCGILVGQSCTNIMVTDMVIQGASHADGAIQIKGTSSNETSNLTLQDIVVSGNSTIGLKCSYCQNLKINNVSANSNTHSGALSAINLNNCNNVTGDNISASNNNGTTSTIALEIDTCKDVTLSEISTTSNTHSGGGSNGTEGIKINSSNNINLSDIKANNLTKTKYGLSCLTSKNIVIENLEISNCAISSPEALKTIYITNSQSVEINHATIANNTVTNQSFTGIALATSTNKYININDVHVINNSTTGAEQSCTGMEITNTEMALISSCSISRNTSAGDLYGIKVLTSSSDIHLERNHIIHNSSSSTGLNKIVAGIHCASVDGLKLYKCESVRNTGTGQAYGAYLDTINHATINDCIMNGNAAGTGVNEDKPSAGMYMKKCNHCVVENSSFINNQAGNKGTANTNDQTNDINITTQTTIGAGIINIGQDANTPNIGNQYINCTFNGNRTQIGTTEPSSSHFNYDASNYRYSTNHALAAGAINQFSKHTTYKNCTFNSNGHSDYVVSFGLLNVNTAKKTHAIYCTASSNNHYGFCDHGVFTTGPGQKNSEMFFMGCLAMSNGTENSVATTEQTDDHKRNCRVYYSTGGTTESPPFVQMNFETYTQLSSEHSPYINISLKQTS